MKSQFYFVSVFVILTFETGLLNAGQMSLMNSFINSSPSKLSSFSVNMKRPIHVVSDKFLSLTVDPDTLIHMTDCDLSDATTNMAKSLSPAYIRVSGPQSNEYYFQSSQDQIFSEYSSRHERQNDSKNHTITGTQWVALNHFISKAGLNMIIALNGAMENKENLWDLSNPLDLITFSDRMKYNLDFALGHEVQQGGEDRGKEIGRNVQRLRKVLEAFPRYHNSLIIGPDMTNFETRHDVSFIRKYLTEAGEALSAFTWHPEFSKLKKNDDGYEYLSNVLNSLDNYIWMKDGIFKPISKTIPRKPIWIAESEHKEREGTFSESLTSLTRLGSAAKLGISVFMKKPHLLSLYEPTSEYWISLLHKSLIGRNVLDVKAVNGNYTQLHVYGHCTNVRENEEDGVIDPSLAYEKGAITIFGVNMANERARLNLKFGLRADETVHEYIITEEVDRSGLRSTFLNGQELRLSKDDELPMLHPKIKTSSKYLSVPARSAFFIVFPNMKSRVCTFNAEEIETKIKLKINSILQEPEDVESEDNIEFDIMDEEPSHHESSSYVTFPRRKQQNADQKWKDEKKITEPIVKYVTFTDDSWLSSFPKILSRKSNDDKLLEFSSEEEILTKNHKNITKELELLDEHHRCTDEEVKSNKCTKRHRRSLKYDFNDDNEDPMNEQFLEDYFDDDSEYYLPSLFENSKGKESDIDNNLKHGKESSDKDTDLGQDVELIIVKANYPKIRKENSKNKYNAKSEDFQDKTRQKREVEDLIGKDSLEGVRETATERMLENTNERSVEDDDEGASEHPELNKYFEQTYKELDYKIENTTGWEVIPESDEDTTTSFGEGKKDTTKRPFKKIGVDRVEYTPSITDLVIGVGAKIWNTTVGFWSSTEAPNKSKITTPTMSFTSPATVEQGIVSESKGTEPSSKIEVENIGVIKSENVPQGVASISSDSTTNQKSFAETTGEVQRESKTSTDSVTESTTSSLKKTREVQAGTLEGKVESERLIVSPFSKNHNQVHNSGKSAEEKLDIVESPSINQDTQTDITVNDEAIQISAKSAEEKLNVVGSPAINQDIQTDITLNDEAIQVTEKLAEEKQSVVGSPATNQDTQSGLTVNNETVQISGKSAEEKTDTGSPATDTQLGKTLNEEAVGIRRAKPETHGKHAEATNTLHGKKIEDTKKKQEKNVKQGKKELKSITATELTEKYKTRLQELQERYKAKLEELKKKLQKQQKETSAKTSPRIKREVEKSDLLEKINKKMEEIKENFEARQAIIKQKIEDLTHTTKSKKEKRSVESDLKGGLDAALEKVKEKVKASQENRASRREEINKMRKERQQRKSKTSSQEKRPKRHIRNNDINTFKSKYENNLHNDNEIFFHAEDAIEITNELFGNYNSKNNRIERSLNNYILREDYENEIIPEEDMKVKIYKKKFRKPEMDQTFFNHGAVLVEKHDDNSKVLDEIETSDGLTSSTSTVMSTLDDLWTTDKEPEVVRKDFITTIIKHASNLLLYFRYLMNL